jgi:hypothetical protein
MRIYSHWDMGRGRGQGDGDPKLKTIFSLIIESREFKRGAGHLLQRPILSIRKQGVLRGASAPLSNTHLPSPLRERARVRVKTFDIIKKPY